MKNSNRKDPFIFGVIALSILILIIGSLVFGILESIIMVVILDIIILIVGDIMNKKNKSNQKTNINKINKPIVKKPASKEKGVKKTPKEIWAKVLTIIFSIGIAALSFCILFFAYIVIASPKFDPEKLYDKEASVIYDDSGTEVAKLGLEVRELITYDELPEVLIDAIVATEDSRFFQHDGVDLPRFLKASISQVLGKGGGGASTLTMQVVKNSFTSTKVSIIRKFTDVYMAVFKVEKHYTKEEILEFYVNSNYMGHGNYGVEQASKDYFQKSAKDMNLAEAAMIAGMFQAPDSYDPYINPELCEQRRRTVLDLMLRHGYINEAEYNIAKEITVDQLVTKSAPTQKYQDFIDTVVAEVVKRTGNDPYTVPMDIYTTMNKNQQDNMNSIMNGENYKWADDDIQGASVVINVNTGAITAVGGGRNRTGERGYNLATMMERQIGSTAKPIYDYGPGIEYNGWNTYTPFLDAEYSYSDGTNIRNWDSQYFGYLTLHDSLKYSRNVSALKAFQQVDNKKIIEFATKLGMSPEISGGRIHEAHAIGGYNGESPLKVAAAYAAFSNGGYYIEPHSFNKIVYKETNEEYSVKANKTRAMSDSTAYMITKVLEDTSGYAVGLSVNGVNYAAKTGTTDLDEATRAEYNMPKNAIGDRWIASFNDTYAIAVWYGYSEHSKNNYLTINSTGHKYLFQAIAKSVYTKNSTWEQPNSVVEVEVEKGLPEAKLASEFTPSDLKLKAYFKKGLEPTEESQRFSQLSNVSNLNYNNSTKTLTWDQVSNPQFLTENYLRDLFTTMYGANSNSYYNDRVNWNNKNIGSITYEVYIKNNNGTLTHIGNTSGTSLTYQTSGTTTFVVKTSYSIFKNNASSGSELTVQSNGESSFSAAPADNGFTANNGKYEVTLMVNDPYDSSVLNPQNNPIIIYDENMTPIASNRINVSILSITNYGASLANLSDIVTTSPAEYQIAYSVSVQGSSWQDVIYLVIKVKQ